MGPARPHERYNFAVVASHSSWASRYLTRDTREIVAGKLSFEILGCPECLIQLSTTSTVPRPCTQRVQQGGERIASRAFWLFLLTRRNLRVGRAADSAALW